MLNENRSGLSTEAAVIINEISTHSSVALVSDYARRIFQWVCFGIVSQVIDLFGTGTNVVNIVCFIKQGFRDPINISLLGLAISDLGSLLTLIWTNICFTPAFEESDLPFEPAEMQYLTTAWPHVIFTRITGWITAVITLERCLCITMPLKVKNIITPKRTTIIIISIFIILSCGAAPVYYTSRYAWKYSQHRNRTILGLVYTADRANVEQVSFVVNNVFFPFTAFLIILICTIILVVTLRKKAKWRRKNASSMDTDATWARDQKVSKMVVVISSLFIACFIPSSIIFMAMAMEPELAIGGKYLSMLIVVYGIGLVLESTNSAMNIFIYYHMSTKYKTAFQQLFFRESGYKK